MTNPASKTESVFSTWFKIIVPSLVIPVAGALVLNQLFDSAQWVNEPFHALLESMGSFSALFLAMFIITMRNNQRLCPRYIWVATTLMGMGLLDGFHAGISAGNAFVWLHSLATFVGGVTFALVVLPVRYAQLPAVNKAPWIMSLFAVTVGIGSVVFPEWIPQMIRDGHFSGTAEVLNFIGGLGFILAAIHFMQKQNTTDVFERALLANHTLLFGAAALLFHFSLIWDATWWLWHVLRLIAYVVILVFFLRLYFDSVREIRINEQKLTEKTRELERERSLTSGIIENSPSIISLKDTDGRYMVVNQPFCRLFGLDKTQVYGQSANDLFETAIAAGLLSADTQVLNQNQSVESEIAITLNGKIFTFISTKFPLKDASGSVYAIGSILTDITQRKRIENELLLSQKIIDHTNEGVLVTDSQGIITKVNIAYSEITGYSARELLNKSPRFLKSGLHDDAFYQKMWKFLTDTGHWSGEIWDHKKNGQAFPQWLSISAIKDAQKVVTHYVGIMHDITAEKNIEAELKNIAYYDALTGIPNRVLFKDRLTHEMAHNHRENTQIALLFIDLDDFKLVNDSLGHDAGDELLALVAKTLKQQVRSSDTVARLGGDEFAIILPQLTEFETASKIAQKIITELRAPVSIQGRSLTVGASIGISTFPNDALSVEELTKFADLALYSAKNAGRNNFKFFSQALQDQTNHYIELQAGLKKATQNHEFEVYYQPKICLQTQSLVGMEALIRWNHPVKGVLTPIEFISFAEQTGLILPIGAWILQAACRQAEIWSQALNRSLEVAINLSTQQFKDEKLIKVIQQALQESGVHKARVELEITETSLFDNIEQAIQTMHAIRELGITLAIDDFGTGFSSLSYLKRFPISTLKIDRSFVKDLAVDEDDKAIVESIIAMSEKLKLKVVAEGIETQAQLDLLKERNCHYGQGYLFAKPLRAEEFERLYIQS
ncbi:EAL domain-containing protein [Thiosulfativibrio zosterae]|uniref:cyclic-guanylate-specific phosphodiesterase n=1 Tax=Thiosulfativibrio zosterae TaxID=2675053 RepID=A0A6F8PR21_9GAMM|nr:EAL domain-containing protein [Thiosulfativibrio zosterae]BBP44571.1 hypothetical protein THMIRHAT_23170 [Thiosulfativibrio zosterae]